MGELIVNGIKWAFIIGVGLTFMTAISTIISLLVSVTSTSIIGEIFGIISCCLPFDASSVFMGIFGICGAILSFVIAQKIYNLVSAKVQV